MLYLAITLGVYSACGTRVRVELPLPPRRPVSDIPPAVSREPEVPSVPRLVLFVGENQQGWSVTIYRDSSPDHRHAGDVENLAERRYEFGEVARSATLYGPPGTTVWLYRGRYFAWDEGVLEIKVIEGTESTVVNDLNRPQLGVGWEVRAGGAAQRKVLGVQWR